ncbi:DUF6629 family protein [Candidatus Protochlamydia phocaeensis]|uniref:DUF6629 family protein n=1 Tax=Candidatus Protochlamydia phocaeensis TaxID=1414722 RepID=UPI000838DE23|nr:DUF6629 family protein [Candidatus Protochlamydia phocaeensis]
MCFSAEASFTASAVLGAIGGSSLRNCSSKSYFFLAAIPFLFAIQQFSEGILWLQLNKQLSSASLLLDAKRIFLIFAFIIWPIWLPLSFALIEKVEWRRTVLYFDLACGLALSSLNLFYALHQDVSVRIVNHSLQYSGEVPSQTYLYPFIVLLPCFISSVRMVWLFGFFVLLGYLTADYFYTSTFVSVWCFFAALVSLFIYKVIKDNQLSLEKKSLN